MSVNGLANRVRMYGLQTSFKREVHIMVQRVVFFRSFFMPKYDTVAQYPAQQKSINIALL